MWQVAPDEDELAVTDASIPPAPVREELWSLSSEMKQHHLVHAKACEAAQWPTLLGEAFACEPFCSSC